MDDEQRLKVIRTITKLLNLEQRLVLEAYEKENMLEKQLEYEKVKDELKNKISMFSEDLVHLSISTNAAIEQLIASSGEVNDTFQKTSSLAVNSVKMAQEGSLQMDELNKRISSIYERTHEMEDYVKELTDASKQIEYIVDSVKEFASQAKMLSLNATIEAARAGEHEIVLVEEQIKLLITTIEGIGHSTSQAAGSAERFKAASAQL